MAQTRVEAPAHFVMADSRVHVKMGQVQFTSGHETSHDPQALQDSATG
jgi:hypothetical protein